MWTGRTILQHLGQRSARQSWKMVVSHVKPFGACLQHFDQFGVAMSKIIGAAIQVQIDQTTAIHVKQVIAFTPVNHQIDAHVYPVLCFTWIPKLF